MVCSIEKSSAFKAFCLRRKLRRLKSERQSEITGFIVRHPDQAAKMDNIEKQIPYIKQYDLKIGAVQRLLEQISKN